MGRSRCLRRFNKGRVCLLEQGHTGNHKTRVSLGELRRTVR